FVDTNVLVYAHDASAGEKRSVARSLLERLWNRGEACASIQVLQEFYVTVTRKAPHRLGSGEAAGIVRNLAAWVIFVPGFDDVMAAIDLQQRLQISFWDAMILRSAVELDCELIWSEDLNAGQVYEGVSVANPFTAV
ncbi:MAG: PIN domain-containing protein, partial [Candidatus Solibacter usitatus]|nr:PIN domain-containing protein [Candidatus Solibacter usitatus]